jgi:hypothetical protein
MNFTKEDLSEMLAQQDYFEKEEQFAEEVATEIFPYLDEITKEEIKDHNKLKSKLDYLFSKKIKQEFSKFKDIILGIFQVSFSKITGGFFILDQSKLLILMKDKISGQFIIDLIKKTPSFIINPLCSLVNIINERKFNLPDKLINDLMAQKITQNLKNKL